MLALYEYCEVVAVSETGHFTAEYGLFDALSMGTRLKLGLLQPTIQENFVGVDLFILA
ncbi:hypothetical protein [Gimesia alba]|uniref:hypothetical protein n=1 Tax=Gimesia alba TaxID=2527973 RepID=UPI0018D88664|nr:hypothetical protein [Gimesia alba]